MRHETVYASAALVHRLKASGVSVLDDGGDIIHTRLRTGEKVAFHLIESDIPLYEIKHILTDNTAQGYATAFMFWCDMLLPGENQYVLPDAWLRALLTLYGDTLYAYEFDSGNAFLFPVHFTRRGAGLLVSYGVLLDTNTLATASVTIDHPELSGVWTIGNFDRESASANMPPFQPGTAASLAACYALLKIELGADIRTIKRAYRQLAMQYHPDINPTPEANEQMQRLNQAYQTIMKSLTEE